MEPHEQVSGQSARVDSSLDSAESGCHFSAVYSLMYTERIIRDNVTIPCSRRLRNDCLIGPNMITLPSQRFISNQVFISLRRVPCNLPTLPTLPSLSKSFLRPASLHTMPDSEKTGFYSLSATLPGNKTLDFADLKGKVVLIVNTASACGFTPQYKGLLYE